MAVIVATIAVLSLGALALIGRFADYGQIAAALRSADPRWLPVCGAGVCVVFAGLQVEQALHEAKLLLGALGGLGALRRWRKAA